MKKESLDEYRSNITLHLTRVSGDIEHIKENVESINKHLNLINGRFRTAENNITAVKRSIRNLVFLNFYEKPFNPDIGSDIRATLFEPVSQLSAFVLTRNIEEVVENYEPRARIISITALPTLDRNAYNVSLSFFVVNVPTELVDLTLFLERLR